MYPQTTFWRNLRDFPSTLTLGSVVSGFVVTLIGYTGPLLIVLQAAKAGGLTDSQTASWLWAITVGDGLLTVFMSLYYRQPLIAPWSTAGTVLLVTALGRASLPQAVGAYILVGLAQFLLGWSGLFGRLVRLIPQPVVMGMLAGILLRFGLNIYKSLPAQPLMIGAMLLIFFILRRLKFPAPTLGVLIIGLITAVLTKQFVWQPVSLALTIPQLVMPEFSVNVALSLALPLFVLALTSQFMPGEAVLRSFGYEPPINGILAMTGIGTIILAFFGGSGQVLGALTAAIAAGPEASPQLDQRYGAAIQSGLWYFGLGLFGATLVGLFTSFPPALIGTVAGLALSGTIASSLHNALADPSTREAALVAFLMAASEVSIAGIGAPFWALMIGTAAYLVLTWRRR